MLIASSLSGAAAMSSIEVILRPSVARQCAASAVRAVARRYARTSGMVAEIRSGPRAAKNTSAVRSSASGWLPTRAKIVRYTQVTLSR
jgi:hypothetical protein